MQIFIRSIFVLFYKNTLQKYEIILNYFIKKGIFLFFIVVAGLAPAIKIRQPQELSLQKNVIARVRRTRGNPLSYTRRLPRKYCVFSRNDSEINFTVTPNLFRHLLNVYEKFII